MKNAFSGNSANSPLIKSMMRKNDIGNIDPNKDGSPGIQGAHLQSDFWEEDEKLTSLENKVLVSSFTEEEIKHVVFSSDKTGAPGPDGLPFGFYQHFWDLVKTDLHSLVLAFAANQLSLEHLNKVVVCLIPKEKEVTSIKQYWPISLVNCSMKIISKVLTVRMFNKGRSANLLQGLGPSLNNGQRITNCHYADDTILFLKAFPRNLKYARWTMLGFEALSGIKLNFSKTELIPFNISPTDGLVLADIFGCKLSKLPLKYLGVPLSDKKLTTAEWSCIVDKVTKKLQGWVGNLLSIGGHLTLVNSVLTAVPLYMLSLYKMPVKIRKQIDRVRQ
ncbi:uncharacterized protein LOC144569787 [Carex rostrata]